MFTIYYILLNGCGNILSAMYHKYSVITENPTEISFSRCLCYSFYAAKLSLRTLVCQICVIIFIIT